MLSNNLMSAIKVLNHNTKLLKPESIVYKNLPIPIINDIKPHG